jgi:hypothetical protein
VQKKIGECTELEGSRLVANKGGQPDTFMSDFTTIDSVFRMVEDIAKIRVMLNLLAKLDIKE